MFTSIYKHALKNLSCIIVKTDNVPSHQVLCLNQVRIWFWHHTTITRLIKSRSDVSILNNRDLVCFTTLYLEPEVGVLGQQNHSSRFEYSDKTTVYWRFLEI